MSIGIICLCPEHRTHSVTLESGLELLQCEGCGLYARRHMPDSAQLTAHYRNEYWTYYAEEHATEARANLFQHVMKRVQTRHEHVGHLLDIGCGVGQLLHVARSHGWTASGIEPSIHAAECGRQTGSDICVGEWPQSRWPEQSADAVVFLNVLDHLPNPVAAVQAAWQALRPMGVLYVRVPNGPFHVGLLGRRSVILSRLAVLHLYGFGGRALRQLLTGIGFHDVDVRTAPLSQQDAYVEREIGLQATLRYIAKVGLEGIYRVSMVLGSDRWAWGPSIEATAVKPGR